MMRPFTFKKGFDDFSIIGQVGGERSVALRSVRPVREIQTGVAPTLETIVQLLQNLIGDLREHRIETCGAAFYIRHQKACRVVHHRLGEFDAIHNAVGVGFYRIAKFKHDASLYDGRPLSLSRRHMMHGGYL
jgi:hypothetical protein